MMRLFFFLVGRKMKKIIIIGTVGLPAKYGGFETLTEYLTLYLAQDYKLTVYCSAKSYDQPLKAYNNAQLEYINLKANGIQSIPYDIISFFKACRKADTVLVLGVSGCIILPLMRHLSKTKYVVNIDGLEWKRQKWNKYAKWFLKFSEKMAVNYSDVVVTDNKVIQDYVQDEYHQSSELIAYGADHVLSVDISKKLLDQYPFLAQDYAFSVCRIEPENNLHLIIEALSHCPKVPLVIVGNWEASQYGQNLRSKFAHCEHIHLLDPIYEQNTLNQIRAHCILYFHGHSAGGTNPSLVEAMYLGLPIIAYDIAYNKETTQHKALYFSSIPQLESLVTEINSEQCQALSKDMLAIAHKHYTWKKIAQQYAELF